MIGMDGMVLLYRFIRIRQIRQITAIFKHKMTSKSRSDLYFLVSIPCRTHHLEALLSNPDP